MAAASPRTIAFAIAGPIERAGLPALCVQLGLLLDATGAEIALCDVAGAVADAVVIDALARLQLAARRRGCQVRLCHASGELLELLAFVGLCDVLDVATD